MWTQLGSNYEDGLNTTFSFEIKDAPATAVLKFSSTIRTEESYDFLRISINGTEVFSKSGTYDGTDTIALTPFANSDTLEVKFNFKADGSNTARGVMIDNVTVNIP